MKRFNARFEGKDENGVITRTAIDGIEAENSVEALAVIERFLQSEFVGIKRIERFDNVLIGNELLLKEVDTE